LAVRAGIFGGKNRA